jgi:acyl-CoA reductase-like NAD-dependent aldehyde dehydrogenase
VNEAADAFSANAEAAGKPWAESFADVAAGLVQFSVGVNRSLTAEVDLVHFVGGDVTGNIISKSRGLKPTILEMGGSNVAVIMDSAVADDNAAQEVAKKIYEGFAPATGQRCTAPRTLCVEEGAEAVVTALGKMVADGDHHIGNPFTKGTKMGPLVDRGARQKMEEAITLATELGAKVYGSMAVNSNAIPQSLNENSFWVKPIVIDWAPVDLADAKKAERVRALLGEEIFGPLVHVLARVKGLDAAIATTNKYDTHGLAGAIFTGNLEDVDKYAAGVRVTSLTVNEGPKDRSPFGPHGHPGLATIGGKAHFNLYANETVVALPKPKPKTGAPAA